MKIRTLIVDDEARARERLRQLLESEPGIEIIGECADGRAAVEAIREHSPDLLFLDVQMPELDGFAVLEAIGTECLPVIVFVTAHDKFALRAFDVHAVDYLLKPFDRERFQAALRRAMERVPQRDTGALDQRISALLAELRPPPATVERLAVKSGGRVILVKPDDIDWIEAADNYAELHAVKEAHLIRETLSALEARLAPGKFIRISRSVIVNTDRIKELEPLFHGEYQITLSNGVKLTLSRSYRNKLPQLGVK
ncbi:MAG TPA: LytTR family DNA-binding domain-containing protein [Verrucomicrobiae bacterium]|nr:LytTR family DNA-binding domain-containing protein [Verrucomicrobiae bacterium]